SAAGREAVEVGHPVAVEISGPELTGRTAAVRKAPANGHAESAVAVGEAHPLRPVGHATIEVGFAIAIEVASAEWIRGSGTPDGTVMDRAEGAIPVGEHHRLVTAARVVTIEIGLAVAVEVSRAELIPSSAAPARTPIVAGPVGRAAFARPRKRDCRQRG